MEKRPNTTLSPAGATCETLLSIAEHFGGCGSALVNWPTPDCGCRAQSSLTTKQSTPMGDLKGYEARDGIR